MCCKLYFQKNWNMLFVAASPPSFKYEKSVNGKEWQMYLLKGNGVYFFLSNRRHWCSSQVSSIRVRHQGGKWQSQSGEKNTEFAWEFFVASSSKGLRDIFTWNDDASSLERSAKRETLGVHSVSVRRSDIIASFKIVLLPNIWSQAEASLEF